MPLEPWFCFAPGSVHKVVKLSWQLGSETWIEPFAQSEPTRQQALRDQRVSANIALRDWFQSEQFYLPSTCLRCGQATRDVCDACGIGVCSICQDDLTTIPFSVICCEMMARNATSRISVSPNHVGATNCRFPKKPFMDTNKTVDKCDSCHVDAVDDL